MMKLIYVIVIIVVIFIGLTFSYMNNQLVEVRYLSFSKQMDLSLLLLLTFIFGAILGFIANFLSSLKLRRNLSRLKKERKNLGSPSL